MRFANRQPRRRSMSAVLTLAAVLVTGLAQAGMASPAAAADFPAADWRYHSYDEMVTEIHAAEITYPAIVDVFSIGQSYQGREIWAAKVSDNVAIDEAEPEILFDALTHAREHLTVEQALYLLATLTTGYGTDSTVTHLVDDREITIIFALNPDGGEYDLTGPANGPRGPYRGWRKNRQPNAGSTSVGTDLNRNFDYRWRCCGGSSGTKSSLFYRGSSAFSAPETRAFRDYVNSRVVNGRQQIVSHITFHTNGQLILWPYGHTKVNVPADMTTLDQRTFVAFGKGQARRNGYVAKQSSDLYITDGDMIDWMYGRHRIFSFTWELFPPERPTVWGDHYPPDEEIEGQMARNRDALLYFLEASWCPYATLGYATQITHCGPFQDDFEVSRGWQVNPNGTDTAVRGQWQLGNPSNISLGGRLRQRGTSASGRQNLVTGAAVGGTASRNDVDGGTTTIRSTPIELPAVPGDLTFAWSFGTWYASTAEDAFQAFIEAGDGTRTLVFERRGARGGRVAAWATARVPLSAWGGQTIRIVFAATDGGRDNLVDAGVDDVRVEFR
jgi:murein tripeptide amidase MpaA